jgi:antitoxin component of MazEF toxin-antitoxin module
MKTIALRKSGGSLIFAAPAFFAETNRLSAGDKVEIMIEGQSMIVRPARRLPRYTLEQLLAEHEGNPPQAPGWDNMPPVGQETEGL